MIAFAAVLALALTAIAGRLLQMQLVQSEKYAERARANQIRLVPLPAPRGRILDRHGVVLVRNKPSFICVLVPSELSDPEHTIGALAPLLGIDAAALRERILHRHGVNYKDFGELAELAPYAPVIVADNLTQKQIADIVESRLPGVDVGDEAIRDYPFKSAASHVFGYVGAITDDEFKRLRSKGYTQNDLIGKDGLEYTHDDLLRGVPGGLRVVVDAQGQIVQRLSPTNPTPGHELVLTIDWRLQQIVESALAAGIQSVIETRHRHIAGAAVVLDPYTGGVLAMASLPNFDPNDFARGISSKKFTHYLNDRLEPLYNRSIAAATATGSTFKLITGSAALTTGVIKKDEMIYDSGEWLCHGHLFRDIAAGGLGYTNFVRALAASSDGYFYRAADLLGYDRLTLFAHRFGIDAKTGIDLPGEYPGNWPTDAWTRKTYGVPLSPSDVCQLGIGQGAMQATPLQMASVVAAVVNGGTLYRPHLVDKVIDANGRIVTQASAPVIRDVGATKASLAAVREGMALVTSPGGTAYGLAIDGVPFGGKTGTVETGGGTGPNTTWFIAFAPVAKPKLAIAVFMEQTGGYGAEVAAPVAREIMKDYLLPPPAPSPSPRAAR
jgi:penicillin-binding protein 2